MHVPLGAIQQLLGPNFTQFNATQNSYNKPEILSAYKAWVKFFNTQVSQ
jgi:hypothetical protein